MNYIFVLSLVVLVSTSRDKRKTNLVTGQKDWLDRFLMNSMTNMFTLSHDSWTDDHDNHDLDMDDGFY